LHLVIGLSLRAYARKRAPRNPGKIAAASEETVAHYQNEARKAFSAISTEVNAILVRGARHHAGVALRVG